MIEFQNVVLHYHYEEYPLLKGTTFTLRDGLNTILADTQSGKSSICKLLCKEVAASSGKIIVDGKDISSISSAHLGILYLPSAPAFFDNRSVRANIEYPLKVRKVARYERRQRAEQVAAFLGIDYLDKRASKLTNEQRRLVALARGLTVERKVVLFDDFFQFDEADTSIEHIHRVLNMFSGATCVIATSDKSLALGNTVVLDGGVTVYEGDAAGAAQLIDGLQWLHSSLKE